MIIVKMMVKIQKKTINSSKIHTPCRVSVLLTKLFSVFKYDSIEQQKLVSLNRQMTTK